MQKLLMITTCVLLMGCTDADGAAKALRDQGLEPVSVGGYAFFGCSDKDTFSTKFTAMNAKGNIVNGQVCSGWFKGKTIRFD